MKIGIIGAGNIGATAARLFVEAGHEVEISNSRGPETLSDLVEEIGGDVRAVTIGEAADSRGGGVGSDTVRALRDVAR